MSTFPSRPLLSDDDPRHGTITAYLYWGCRCERCMKSNRDRQREYMRHYRAKQKEQQTK